MEIAKAISTKHIVVYADDDADDLMFVQHAFANYASNFEVVTMQDGKEALLYLESLTPLDPIPCLIILDVNMPRVNGKEALKTIRDMEAFVHTPVVLFTNSSLALDKILAQEYEAGFITKPFDPKEMQMIASQFIDHCTDEVKNNIQRRSNG